MAMTDTELTLRHPELGTGPVSTDVYWKPEFYERELRAIFRQGWLCIGREERIPHPGDFFTKELPTFKLSIIVARGKDGVVRAFHNVCQHRGAGVELRDSGSCRVFTCPFHGWSYNLEGELQGVPDQKAFYALQREKKGLPRLACDTWEGFVFVSLNPEPAQGLREYLGELGTGLEGFAPFHRETAEFEYTARIQVNWKLMLDSFTEIYHVPVLHKRSVAASICGPNNPYGRLVDVFPKYPHRMATLSGNPEYRPFPVQGLAYGLAAGPSVTSGGSGSTEDLPAGVNPTRDPLWTLDLNVVFPNMIVIVGPGMYFTHTMWPIHAGETIWQMHGHLQPAANAAQRFAQENAMVELRDAVMEDVNTLERIQNAISQGLCDEFVFHDHELTLRYQHYTVLKWVEDFEKTMSAGR